MRARRELQIQEQNIGYMMHQYVYREDEKMDENFDIVEKIRLQFDPEKKRYETIYRFKYKKIGFLEYMSWIDKYLLFEMESVVTDLTIRFVLKNDSYYGAGSIEFKKNVCIIQMDEFRFFQNIAGLIEKRIINMIMDEIYKNIKMLDKSI